MSTNLATDLAIFRRTFESFQSLLAVRGMTNSRAETLFVVRARFVGAATKVIAADSLELFLDSTGHWRSIANAMKFESREAAEVAVTEARRRIRNSGNRTVSISVRSVVAGWVQA
jgi:hypothetical protein